jgi:hypothetical protein
VSSVSERSSETGHLTAEQLDELATRASADLDPDQAAHTDDLLERHLAGCPSCREALGDQVAVRRLLQRVPDTGPMPTDVAARLDAALRSARPAPAASATVLPMTTRSERRGALVRLSESRLTKSLVAAAAVGLIAVGGYAAIGRSAGGPGGVAASTGNDSSAAGGKAAPNLERELSSVPIEASGTAYTKANITAELTKRLANGGGSSQSGFTAGVADTTTLTTPAGLRACLSSLGTPASVPVLVDLATYEGKPVAVLVLPGPAGVGRQVWVVSRTCAGTRDGLAYYGALN